MVKQAQELYDKYKNSQNDIILIVIFQLKLIEEGIRKTAQIDLYNYQNSLKEKRWVTKCFDFLKQNNIVYLHETERSNRIVIGNLHNLDTTFGEKFGKQLGSFYKMCNKKMEEEPFPCHYFCESQKFFSYI